MESDIKLHVLQNQLKTDPGIIFLHGNSLDAETFSRQFQSLAVPMVAIDLPGHGKSEKAIDPQKSYSIPSYIEILVETIDQLNLDEFILVGHSLGGHLAIEMISQLKRAKGLLIIGTPPLGMPPEMDKMFTANPLLNLLFQKEIEPTQLRQLSDEFTSGNPELSKQISDSIANTDGLARSFLANSFAEGKFQDELTLLEEIQVPLAVIHGTNDGFVNPDYLKRINSNKLWEGKIQFIENAGHLPQLENYQQFNKILLDFYKFVFKTEK